MALDIDDGYTVAATTKPDFGKFTDLPIVFFRYRPALWHELTTWRRTIGSETEIDATAKMVVDHLASWDVTKAGKASPITIEVVKKIPPPIFDQLWDAVTTWAPKEQETAAGNSGAASA